MHAVKKKEVGRGARGGRGVQGTRDTMGKVPPVGKPPVYFAPGDLVFAGRPREYHCWLTTAAILTARARVYVRLVHAVQWREGKGWGRGAYLEPRI